MPTIFTLDCKKNQHKAFSVKEILTCNVNNLLIDSISILHFCMDIVMVRYPLVPFLKGLWAITFLTLCF